jgi:hypothetical protein
MGATVKYALRYPDGTDAANVPLDMQELASDVDSKFAGYAEGLKAAIPAAGKNGRLYRATDTKEWFFDTGTAWALLIGSQGFADIPAEQARTNVAYGLMTTADRIQGVVVSNGDLLRINYRALIKNSVGGAGSINIFIGANPLKLFQGGGAPGLAEVLIGGNTDYNIVHTDGLGLVPSNPAGDASFVGTGMATPELVVEVDPGVYDISVQTKSSSGSVTMKERRLRVRTESYLAA